MLYIYLEHATQSDYIRETVLCNVIWNETCYSVASWGESSLLLIKPIIAKK